MTQKATLSSIDPKSLDSSLIQNQRLQAAIERVLERGGKGSAVAVRYDRQHHKHNKS